MSPVMHRCVLLSVLLLGAKAFAQVPAAGLSGTVVDERGALLVGVRVEVQLEDEGADLPAALTAEDGRFAIEGLKSGRDLVLELAAPDGRRRLILGVRAAASGLLDLGPLVLPPPARLEGRVVTADGAGLPGAEISLWSAGVALQRIDGQLQGLSDREHPLGRCQADADGRFACPASAPGWATVAAWAPGHAPDIRSVLLSAGTVTQIDLQPGPGFVLRGRVVAPDASQPVGGRVSVSQSRSSFPVSGAIQRDWATLGADGGWELSDLPAGQWFVQASVPGYDGKPVTVDLPQAAEAAVDLPLVADAPQAGSIDAFVVDEQGHPLDSFTLWCASFWGERSVPGGLSIPWGEWVPFAFGPGAGGRARLGPLEVGDYQLIATTDGQVSNTTKVSVRSEPASVEARLSVAPAQSLRVEAVDERTGTPLSGIQLSISLEAATYPLEDRAETDATGTAVIGRLPPGPLSLRVVGDKRDRRDQREETHVTLPHADLVRIVGEAPRLLHVRLSRSWRAAGAPGEWFDRSFVLLVRDAEGDMVGFVPNVVESAALTLAPGDYHLLVAAYDPASTLGLPLPGVGPILAKADVTLGEGPVTAIDF